jgi:hypothetical protein
MGRESKKQDAGFGVGALEDQDDDIYATDGMDTYDR